MTYEVDAERPGINQLSILLEYVTISWMGSELTVSQRQFRRVARSVLHS